MSAIEQGRQALQAWEASKPSNFYRSNKNLQYVLRRYLGTPAPEVEERLTTLGGHAATTIDAAAKLEDRLGNHPVLQRWTGIGERVEAIEFHPNHDLIGRLIWEAGLMALQAQPGNSVQQMALFYLLNHNGEAGHMCSLACTSGLIRALQQVGTPELQAKFLPPLLEWDYGRMQHGAQFLTEVQGGSDVGANAVSASPHPDGSWRISGEKWFCSNVNADQFLMTARPVEASTGTRGLGLFLVPRHLEDGSTNGFHIRRLKDKLGTRTLASAELDFREAVAYPVGPLDRGFKNVVELVLNTSRLMNAVACAGIMQRAYIEAASYACHRQAFGKPIAHYPLVQEALADIQSESYAALASSFALAALLDRIETEQASEDEKAVYRMLVNLNKYITSIRGSEIVHRAIEVFGGNGAIESFSILPRLYRDMVVLESWEGTHNVLCLQVLRDIARYQLHAPFFAYLEQQLAGIRSAELQPLREIAGDALQQAAALLQGFAGAETHYAEAHSRRLADALAQAAQGVLLLAEAEWELSQGLPTDKPDLCAHFIKRRLLPAYDPMTDADYLPRLERLMAAY